MPIYYNNTFFRYKLEAQWAVFFDVLGIEYAHRSQIHDWESIGHIPTFYLPDLNAFWEVKRNQPSAKLAYWARRVAEDQQMIVYVAFGDVLNPDTIYDTQVVEANDMISAHAYFPDGTVDFGYWWCECPNCGKIGLEYMGYAADMCEDECLRSPRANKQTHNSFVMLAAYNFAQQYTFDTNVEAFSPEDWDEES